jgi:hypothetical protein
MKASTIAARLMVICGMEYALAKKLKDAGWRQAPKFVTTHVNGVCVPTLEELIEACGKAFGELGREKVGRFDWYASGSLVNGEPVRSRANTPLVAVARLWLALRLKESPPEDAD